MEPKERYAYEFEHRERLRNAVNIPLGVLIVLGGILATMYRGYLFIPDRLTWLFLWLFTTAIYFFCRTTYYLICSYHGHSYATLPLTQDMERYRKTLVEWHKEFGEGERSAEHEYSRYVEVSLAEAADHNAVANATKSEYLFRANAALIYCGILVALSFLPSAVQERQRPDPVYKVELVTPDAGSSNR